MTGEPGQSLAALAPLSGITIAAAVLVAATAALAFAVWPACRRARRRSPALPTWNCGYAAGSPRLQYTASSFGQLIVSHFAWALRPVVERPRLDRLFPAPARFQSHFGDSVLDSVLLPRARRLRQAAGRLRVYQQGNLQQYVLYIAAAIVLLLLFNLRFDWLVSTLCGQ